MTENQALPRVSVIVCTHNDEAFIGECVEALLAQTYPGPLLELIVVDDGSTDGTAAILAPYAPTVRCLRQRNRGPSAARNLGILHAGGEYVCFTDADCRAAPDWVERLVRALRRLAGPCGCAVGGRQTGHPDDPPFARHVDRLLASLGFVADYVKPHGRLRRVGHNASCNAAYSRCVLMDAGGFREGMFPGEDVDLDRRLAGKGCRVWYVPDAVVFHHRPPGPVRLMRMFLSYGRASADNVSIHGFFRAIQVVPLGVAATLAALIWTLAAGNTTWPVAAGLLGGLGLGALSLRSRIGFARTAAFSGAAVLLFSASFWLRLMANRFRPPFDMRRSLDPLSADRSNTHGC